MQFYEERVVKKIKIRTYQDRDAKATYQLFYDTVHNINSKDYNEQQLNVWAPYDKDISQWNDSLKRNKSFVAEDIDTNLIVGFCDMKETGYLNRGYVHKDYQGQGIGSLLLQCREHEAKKLKLNKVFSHVSITARPFFEARGFKVVKQQVVQIHDVEFINFVMEKYFVNCELLSSDHIPSISEAFNQIGWNKPASLFAGYLKDQEAGERLVWVAHFKGEFAGYVTLKWQSKYPSFKAKKIPEVMDLNVLPAYRKIGVGSLLLDTAEKEALTKSQIIGIGVGLYVGEDGGYGPAQKLYVKRGYIPDGKGITYNYEPTIPGNSYPLDDDLVLWFTKRLSSV